MLEIDRLKLDLRLSGAQADRSRAARRMKDVLCARLPEALEPCAQALGALGAAEGPYVVVRRIRLRLWISGASALSESALAGLWAEALARGLAEALAKGAAETVARFPSRAEFLAVWAEARAAGAVAAEDWRFEEFRRIADLPPGEAISSSFAQEGPLLCRQALAATQKRDEAEAVFDAFRLADVLRLWRSLTGAEPTPGPVSAAEAAQAAALAARPTLRPVLRRPEDPEDRARAALGRLSALLQAPVFAPRRAGSLALALIAAEACLRVAPALARRMIEAPASGGAAAARRALAELPATLAAPAETLATVLEGPEGAQALAGLLAGVAARTRPALAAPRSEDLASPVAGAGLLLPVLQASGLAERLGARGREQLLIFALRPASRPAAGGDAVLRRLCGLPAPEEPPPDWPAAEETPERNLASHGEGPEAPAAFRILREFGARLPGLSGSSAAYLAEQFLERPGRLTAEGDRILRLILTPPPLGILLRMGGVLGLQPPIPWLEPRRLILEAADG